MHEIEWYSFIFPFLEYRRVLDLKQKEKRVHQERRERPSPPVELEAAISGSLMEIRSRAATSGAEESWA